MTANTYTAFNPAYVGLQTSQGIAARWVARSVPAAGEQCVETSDLFDSREACLAACALLNSDSEHHYALVSATF